MIKRRIYMDYAAAAPELPVARRAVARAAGFFGNPSSIHKDGVKAAAVLAENRKSISDILGCSRDEIVFTGSGTESDNLAVMGVFKHARLSPDFAGKDVHIVTTMIEHPAILEACRHLERVGAQVTYLSVGTDGLIDLKELRAALRDETVLVSIGYSNSEIGVVQPIREIAKEIRHFKKTKERQQHGGTYPLFHTDACQAAAYLELAVERLGVDLLSLNGTKLGGPRGIGLLYVRRGTPIEEIIYGGGQERALRSGTENLPGIAGLAAALIEAHEEKDAECERLTHLRDQFISEIKNQFQGARINGSFVSRIPNNVHVSFPGISSELLVLELDARGVSASAGSACSGAKDTGSEVLAALYGAEDRNEFGSVRFSFGIDTKMRDITSTLSALRAIAKKYEPWKSTTRRV